MTGRCPTCGHKPAAPRKAAAATIAKLAPAEREALDRTAYRAYGARWGICEDVEFYAALLPAGPAKDAADALAAQLLTRKATPADRKALERMQDNTRPPGSLAWAHRVVAAARGEAAA